MGHLKQFLIVIEHTALGWVSDIDDVRFSRNVKWNAALQLPDGFEEQWAVSEQRELLLQSPIHAHDSQIGTSSHLSSESIQRCRPKSAATGLIDDSTRFHNSHEVAG